MKISVGKLRKVIKEVLEEEEKKKHTCEECGKSLTQRDKASYESEGGKGWPAVCEDCAEDAAY